MRYPVKISSFEKMKNATIVEESYYVLDTSDDNEWNDLITCIKNKIMNCDPCNKITVEIVRRARDEE